MFCQKCGEKLPEGALFCARCGTNQADFNRGSGDTNTNNPPGSSGVNQIKVSGISTDTIKNFIKPAYLAAAAAVVLVIIAVVIIASVIGKRVDLNDFYTVEFEGYDTRGRATGELDYDAFYSKYRKTLRKNNISKSTLKDELDDVASVEIDKESELSNGDEVSVEWNIKEDRFRKKLGLKSKTGIKKYTVDGLEEIDTFDAFEGITLEFTGMAPNGSAEITGADYEKGLEYYVENNGSFSNGDTATLTVTYGYRNEDDYIDEYGQIPKEMTKEYTVEGLDEYLSKFEDIPETLLDSMKREAEDRIVSYTTKSYDEKNKVTGLAYSGYIFLGTKPDGDYWWSSPNGVYLIYKATVTGEPGKLDATTVYYPIWFSTITKTAGEVNYNSCDGIVGSSRIGNNGYGTNGYANPALMYADLATSKEENYTVTSGDGIEIYADYNKVTDVASIDDAALSKLEEKAVDVVRRQFDENYEKIHVDDLKPIGEYLLVAKEQTGTIENDNYIYVICSGTVVHDEGEFEPTTVYFPVLYYGYVGLPDGGWNYEAMKGIQGYTDLSSGWFSSIPGYKDGNAMFTDFITKNRDKYNYEVSEGLKQFGN